MPKLITGPLFKWFGSKWLSSRLLPKPFMSKIIEPFAGAAGYSLRHPEKQVYLYDSNPQLTMLWAWLIYDATESLIKEIPLNLPIGLDIRTIGMSPGQELLLKMWQRTNNVGNCWTISPWGNKPGQWTVNTRTRVAEEVYAIKHWRVYQGNAEGLEYIIQNQKADATWFIDPPYQFNYQYKSEPIDYELLGNLCRQLKSQVIVCEARDPKTAAAPQWLPFTDFGSRITSRRKATQSHHSKELIWTNAS